MKNPVIRISAAALLAAVAGAPFVVAQDMTPGQQDRSPQQNQQRHDDRCTDGQQAAGKGKELQVGQAVPDLRLKDIDGRDVSLAQYKGKVIVLEWIDASNAQWTQQHGQGGDLQRSYDRYKNQDVTWLGICSFQDRAGGQQGTFDSHGASGSQGTTGSQDRMGGTSGSQGTTGSQDKVGGTTGSQGTYGQQPGATGQQGRVGGTSGSQGTYGQQPGATGSQDRVGGTSGSQGTYGQQPGATGSNDRFGANDRMGEQHQHMALPVMDEQQAIAALRRAKAEGNIAFPLLIDKDGVAFKQFCVDRLPFVVIIDKDQKVAYEGAFAGQAGGGQVAGNQRFEQVLDQTVRGGTSLPAGAPREGVTPRTNDRAAPQSNDGMAPRSNDRAAPQSNDGLTPGNPDRIPEANDQPDTGLTPGNPDRIPDARHPNGVQDDDDDHHDVDHHDVDHPDRK